MTQQQIAAETGALGADGSLRVYTVPGSVIATPVSASVIFDGTGAAGNFIPCLTFKTQTGAIIARCPASEVAAGDTAEVSWFPSVGGGPSAAAPFLTSGSYANTVTVTVPDSTLTDMTAEGVAASAPGSQPPFLLDGGSNIVLPLQMTEYRVWCQLAVTWPAGAYDRYIQFNPAAGDFIGANYLVRARGSTTPAADVQVVEGVFGGDPSVPVLLNIALFQTSGVTKTVSMNFLGYGWPRLFGGFYG